MVPDAGTGPSPESSTSQDLLGRLGGKFVSRRRTLSATDFSLLNTLVWATAPLHSDLEFARNSQFGDIILDGPAALAILVGLAVVAEAEKVLAPSGVESVALVGLDNVQFKNPVFANDTIYAASEVTEVRPTRSGQRFIITYLEQGQKIDDKIVITWLRSMLVQPVGGYIANAQRRSDQ